MTELPSFADLPEDLQKKLQELEQEKIIRIAEEGIYLAQEIIDNPKLLDTARNLIEKKYDETWRGLLQHYLWGLKINTKFFFLAFNSILNNYNYRFQSKENREGSTSSGTKQNPHDKKNSGLSGGSHPPPSDLGDREGESAVYKRLSDYPTQMLPGLFDQRKADFGIWISQIALRHFKSLYCELDPSGTIFKKLEKQFKPKYSSNTWSTPIDKNKKAELGICFSLQFNSNGFIRIHGPGKGDLEQFLRDYFYIFKPIFTDEELVVFTEQFFLESYDKPAFYIHDARSTGPKKVVDEQFKGALAKIHEIHWYGQVDYKVYIDYSNPCTPHIEAEGPISQVGHFMKLIDGAPEFVANLSEVREVGYRTREDVNYYGAQTGATLELLKREISNNLNDILGELAKQEVLGEIQYTDIKELFKKAIKSILDTSQNVGMVNNSLELIMNFLDSGFQEVKEEYRNNSLEVELLPALSSISVSQTEIKNKIDDTATKVLEKIESVGTKVEELNSEFKNLIRDSFKTHRKETRNNLELVLYAINKLPDMTASETVNKLQENTNLSRSTLYRYLKRLRDKNLVEAVPLKLTPGPGRPSRLYRLSHKVKNYIKKKKDDESK